MPSESLVSHDDHTCPASFMGLLCGSAELILRQRQGRGKGCAVGLVAEVE